MPIGHIGLNVRDLARAQAYYDEVMPLVGFEPFIADAGQFSYKPAGGEMGDLVSFYPALEEGPHAHLRCGLSHLAFIVGDRAAVHTVHDRVRALGSKIVYPPQEFPQYHPGYYAVFWLDPEGFMLEAVCHRQES
jgi:catechol 2,3-dioxygenase-like lactoylglutathione lyase family enzyme